MGVDKMQINYLAGEYQHIGLYEGCPMKKIEFYKYKTDESLGGMDAFKKKYGIHPDL